MARPMARTATLAVAVAALAASTQPARVHPHVFAEASLDVVVGADGTVRSLRHLWRFDDLFSSTVLMEFDQNADLKLDEAELKVVSETIHGSLAEFNYFQLVTRDGKDVAMTPPDRLIATFEDQQLIVMFESMPKEPIRLDGKLDFGVYDPTFYTAIDFTDDAKMAVADLPESCSRTVVRPDPDEAIAQNQGSLTDAFFNDPSGVDMGKIFATRLELQCKASG
jgi:ABC-type uncharacterized transport system substrate-binding protein